MEIEKNDRVREREKNMKNKTIYPLLSLTVFEKFSKTGNEEKKKPLR